MVDDLLLRVRLSACLRGEYFRKCQLLLIHGWRMILELFFWAR